MQEEVLEAPQYSPAYPSDAESTDSGGSARGIPRTQSFSTWISPTRSGVHIRNLKERLYWTKKAVDGDLTAFLSELKELESCSKDVLSSITDLGNMLIHTSASELAHGRYRQIFSSLQSLEQSAGTTDGASEETLKIVHKLMIIFSKVTRVLFLLEHVSDDGLDSIPGSPRVTESKRRKGRRRANTVLPRAVKGSPRILTEIAVPEVISVDDNMQLGNRLPEDDNMYIDTPPYRDSGDELDESSHGSGTSTPGGRRRRSSKMLHDQLLKRLEVYAKGGEKRVTFDMRNKYDYNVSGSVTDDESQDLETPEETKCEIVVEVPSPLKKPKNADAEQSIELLCRICEKLVPYNDMAEHSKHCSIKNISDAKSASCDEKLSHYLERLESKLKEGKETLLPLEYDSLLLAKSVAKAVLRMKTGSVPRQSVSIKELRTVIVQLEDQGSTPNLHLLQRILTTSEEKLRALLDSVASAKSLSAVGSVVSTPEQTQGVMFRDFEFLKPITRGGVAHVFLARKKAFPDLYAVKILKKEEVVAKNLVKRVKAEQKIMAYAKSPFVVTLYYAFQGKTNLYFVMEYMPGGDLFSLLQSREVFDEDMARHYAAELVLALEYLHGEQITHRDLKPDNLLIGSNGHIKLTDFGLSWDGIAGRKLFSGDTNQSELSTSLFSPLDSGSPKFEGNAFSNCGCADDNCSLRRERRNPGPCSCTSRGSSRMDKQACGTPDYMAPELILGTGASRAVDWWALGIIVFEFLCGCPPFNDDTPEMIFENVVHGYIPWEYSPEYVSSDARDFIDSLLVQDPTKRLGFGGAEEVKKHPFFRRTDWNSVLNATPPFVPESVVGGDTHYFSARHAIFPVSDDGVEDDDILSGSPTSPGGGQKSHFRNFSFVNTPLLAAMNSEEISRHSMSAEKEDEEDEEEGTSEGTSVLFGSEVRKGNTDEEGTILGAMRTRDDERDKIV